MTKNTTNIGSLLQNSLFTEDKGVVETKPSFNDELQAALLRDKTKDRPAPRHPRRERMPRLIDDLRRQLLWRFIALSVAAGAAGYGAYGLYKDYGKKLDEARHTRFIKSVTEGRDAAEAMYSDRDKKVKMVSYTLGESQKKGKGLFAEYKSPLIMEYDATGNGQPDLRVYQEVDPEIFSGWVEGDVANEAYGSWKRYSHRFNDVLQETRDANGSIEDLRSGKIVKFGRRSR